jgi:lipoprotein-anchoring transpeptidase ErfK/SrfK
MRLLAAAALMALSATVTAATANPNQGLFDPLTGRYVVATPSNAGGGRAAATPIPREQVTFKSSYRPGTIIVNVAERRLYLVEANGTALKYGVGVGRPGFEWGGSKTVTRKAEWPSWTPPAQMLRRRPDLPRFMPGGPENPMGARAMYLGSSLYRIHGSNEPETIGQAVSSGCIRMLNEDVIDLYERVKVGAQVVVMR